MKKLITKRNITVLNLVLLGVFVVTLIVVAMPFIKEEPSPIEEKPSYSSSTEDREPSPKMAASEEETYACPRHGEVKSNAPGKCPQCGSDMQKVNRYAAIAERDLFNANLIVKVVTPPAPPPALKLELVGPTKIRGEAVAIIRDKSKRMGAGFQEYMVKVGEELPGYFGVTITSISLDPPSVKYHRPGVGEEELKMGDMVEAAAQGQKDQWAEVVRAVKPGHTYVVKMPELQQRIASPEVYRGTFALEPNMDGSRATGLKITSLPSDNLLVAMGLQQGDILTSINGAVVTDEASAMEKLRAVSASEFSIQLGLTRGRSNLTLYYTLLKK